MKSYEEIENIIENTLGIKNLNDYNIWSSKFINNDHTKRQLITQEDIDLLSPDNIDNNAFWKIIEKKFGADCVGNSYNNQLTNSPEEADKRNMSLARTTGMLNYIDEYRFSGWRILEIGAGYGNFKQYCRFNTSYQYLGFDVFPKIDNILPTELDGTFPRDFIKTAKDTTVIVYSSNVFQHLSSKQRSRYFQDVFEILVTNGIFVFSLRTHDINPNTVTEENRDAIDNRRYLIHYGQFTEIPYFPEILEELKKYFLIMNISTRSDGFTTFTCQKTTKSP